ncbi:POTRA domain-containing protein, partial [Acidihalobacter prosperus]
MAKPRESNPPHGFCVQDAKWAFLALSLVILFISPVIAHASDVPIEVTGLSGPLLANAKGHLAGIDVNCSAPKWQVDSALIQARQQVRRALEALGYYNPAITPELGHRNACWHIRLAVKPGQPVRITNLTLSLAGPGQK